MEEKRGTGLSSALCSSLLLWYMVEQHLRHDTIRSESVIGVMMVVVWYGGAVYGVDVEWLQQCLVLLMAEISKRLVSKYGRTTWLHCPRTE